MSAVPVTLQLGDYVEAIHLGEVEAEIVVEHAPDEPTGLRLGVADPAGLRARIADLLDEAAHRIRIGGDDHGTARD